MAMALIPLIAALGMGVEASNWWLTQRSIQNAADSAAIAAAINASGANGAAGSWSNGVYSTSGCAASPGAFDCEAVGAAAQAGYVNGSSNVVVYPQYLTTGCPGSSSNCYKVTITKELPIHLLGVIGFAGDTTISGLNYQTVKAIAIAQPPVAGAGASPFCIAALGLPSSDGISQDLLINGGPKSSMSGCDSASNNDADCNGQGIGGLSTSYAVTTPNDCAPSSGTDKPLTGSLVDPYANVFTNSSADLKSCGSSFGGQSWSAAPSSWSTTSDNIVCGTLKLTGNVTLNAGTLVIENGELNMNGYNLTATSGSTIVLSGTSSVGDTYTHIITDNSNPGNKSTLTVTAPTSGAFQNVAVYQDPNLVPNTSTSGANLNFASAGSGPTWNINGLFVAPNADVQISGAINKDITTDCIGFIVGALRINGTGYIIETTGCSPLTGAQLGISNGTHVALVQ